MCVWVFLCCKGVSPIVGDQMVWRCARRPFGDGRPLWLCRRLQLRAYAGLGAADPSRRDAEAALRPTPDQDPAPDHRRCPPPGQRGQHPAWRPTVTSPRAFARPAPAAHRPTTQPHHRHQPRRPLAVPRPPWRPAHDPRSHREPLTPAPNLRPSWPDRSDPATHPANTAACYNPDHTARHHDALARLRG